jgi:hypothetical protein
VLCVRLCDDEVREYWKCPECLLIHVPARFHLAAVAEKKRYDLHQNSMSDEGYVRHLMRIVEPVAERVPQGAHGLDFGSGPAPVLARLLESRGYSMALYDRFYADDQDALAKKYDFLVSVETIEHLSDPASVFAMFDRLVVPGGCIGLMTQMVADEKGFAAWHYRNDLTHICFYSAATFEWIGKRLGWGLELCEKDVMVFRTGCVKPNIQH